MREHKLEAFNRIKSIYWDWHIEKQGFKPVFDKSDGEGLKKMIVYLFSLKDSVDEVVKIVQYILSHWDELDDFYKKNTRLRQINGNIHNIIMYFRNGQTTNKSGISADYLQRVVRDMSDSERGN